ncbi:hypothetical protein CPC08DRAFT_215252 [Agrocybe pediades]|nr:hypothetical protein CPC08DRAFT_215252 [Agrocybe pediades]
MFAKLLNFSTQALLAASLLVPLAAAGSHSNPLLNRHHDIARRADGHVDLHRRVSGARWSFYNVETGNAGSCGKKHANSDFTVAMNAGQMSSDMCFKTITMSYNGKTTTATVSDTCPGCPWGGLDLTEGLFSFFAPQSVGIIYGTWEFTDAAPPPPPPPPKPTTTKQTPVWVPPTTTWVPIWVPPTTTKKSVKPTTSSTPPPPPPTTSSTKPSSSSARPSSTSSSSSRASSSSAASSSSVNYQSGVASGLAVPTGTVNLPTGSTQNLVDMFSAFIQVGGIAAAANRL